MASSAAVPHVAREVRLCLLAGGTEGDNNVLMVPTTTPHRCRRHDSYSLVLPIVHPAFHPSHKERGAAPSQGVHSCHFSNANREPRNTSLPLFDVNSTNTHRHTLAQMSTQPCFPVPPPHVQLVYLFPSTHIGFLSVPACYLLKELSGSASLTEGRYNLWGVSGSLEKTMHSQTCSAPAKSGQQISFSYCQSRERAHHSNVAHWFSISTKHKQVIGAFPPSQTLHGYWVTNSHHKLLLIVYRQQRPPDRIVNPLSVAGLWLHKSYRDESWIRQNGNLWRCNCSDPLLEYLMGVYLYPRHPIS